MHQLSLTDETEPEGLSDAEHAALLNDAAELITDIRRDLTERGAADPVWLLAQLRRAFKGTHRDLRPESGMLLLKDATALMPPPVAKAVCVLLLHALDARTPETGLS